MKKKTTKTLRLIKFPNYRDPKYFDDKWMYPTAGLRPRPYKHALRSRVLKGFAEEMEQLWGYIWMMANEELMSPVKLYGIKHNEKMMKLSAALFKLCLKNRWVYSHMAQVEDDTKITSEVCLYHWMDNREAEEDDENNRLAGELDRLQELLPRGMKTRHLIKENKFVEYTGETGEAIKEYVENLDPEKWEIKAMDMIANVRRLNTNMTYIDHRADAIIRWKERHLSSSVKIDRLLILCLELMLPDRTFKNFEEYVATINEYEDDE